MPPKKPKRAYVRRDPYVVAWETATRRLESAREEREECSRKLQALNVEIPKLERMIAALEPPKLGPQDAYAQTEAKLRLSRMLSKSPPIAEKVLDAAELLSGDPEEDDLLPEGVPGQDGKWH